MTTMTETNETTRAAEIRREAFEAASERLAPAIMRMQCVTRGMDFLRADLEDMGGDAPIGASRRDVLRTVLVAAMEAMEDLQEAAGAIELRGMGNEKGWHAEPEGPMIHG